MKYTSIEVVNVLFSTIANNLLMNDAKRPNGKFCKFERPLDSNLEDTVIDDLGLDYDDVQEGVLIVNQYVKNMDFSNIQDHPQQADHGQPDTGRILYLSKLIKQVLGEGEEIWDAEGRWCFKLQQDKVYPDTNNQHYINFRVEFYLSN